MKKLVLLVDTAGWCFENIARQIVRAYGDQYACQILTDVPYDGVTADVALVFWWKTALRLKQANRLRVKRLAVAMYDHWSVPGAPHEFAKLVPHVSCLCAANDALAEDMRLRAPSTPIHLTEDGVDLNMFTPRPLPAEFTVGWCGNRVYEELGLGDLKGVKLIEEACRIVGVPLVIQDKQVRQIRQDEMADKFYRNISCYCCASQCEGTPNPVLEALACGRTVVSTRVGIAPKVVREGVNGVMVDRTLKGLAEGIFKAKQMGDCMEDARNSTMWWKWTDKARAFGPVLEGE